MVNRFKGISREPPAAAVAVTPHENILFSALKSFSFLVSPIGDKEEDQMAPAH